MGHLVQHHGIGSGLKANAAIIFLREAFVHHRCDAKSMLTRRQPLKHFSRVSSPYMEALPTLENIASLARYDTAVPDDSCASIVNRNTSYRSQLGHFHSRGASFRNRLCLLFKMVHTCVIGGEHPAFQLSLNIWLRFLPSGHCKCWVGVALDMGAVCLSKPIRTSKAQSQFSQSNLGSINAANCGLQS